jgi:methionyl-tRNA synthetase
LISKANKFIDVEAPWALAKDPDKKEKLEAVLYELLETLGLTAGLIQPVMPDTSAELIRQVGLPDGFLSLDWREIEKALPPGAPVRQGRSLFPRVEIGGALVGKRGKESKPAKEVKVTEDKKPEEVEEKAGLITFEEFKKLDLRVGLVKTAERIPKSDKLIKMTVDIGEARTIVAGIGKAFTPEDMIGRHVVVLANLAPAKLMGVMSQGMMLAATDKDGLALLTVSREADPGGKIS